jgi:germination protein M
MVYNILKCKKMLVTIVLVACFAAGCGRASGSGYEVYYLNSAKNGLVSRQASVDGQTLEEQVEGLLSSMDEPYKNGDMVVAKPDNVQVERVVAEETLVSVYYNSAYTSMDSTREVLYRAAVVKTLTQLDGVQQVAFYAGGVPITHPDGTVVGVMSGEDFVTDQSGHSSDLKWTNIELYYANARGDKLVPLTVSVAYGKNVPIERVVVEQLISGAEETGYYRTLPAKLKLLGISVNNGTCYVNLDSTFLSEMVNVSESIPIYSIVNSLCQLESINQVQILVNGDSSKMYRESLPLSETYKFNDDIVQQ